eukprot:s2769_g13.t2
MKLQLKRACTGCSRLLPAPLQRFGRFRGIRNLTSGGIEGRDSQDLRADYVSLASSEREGPTPLRAEARTPLEVVLEESAADRDFKAETHTADFERLLKALPPQGALHGLEVLETVVRNVVRFPQEEKFRRLRTSNEKLAPLLGLAGAMPAMECMGWEVADEFLVLPKRVELDYQKHVTKILDAKSHFLLRDTTEKRTAKMFQESARQVEELADLRAMQKQKYQEGGLTELQSDPSSISNVYHAIEAEPKIQGTSSFDLSWCCCCCSWGKGGSGSSSRPKMRTLDDIPRQLTMNDAARGLRVARLLGGG